MKIKLSYLDHVHNYLVNPPIHPDNESEEWEGQPEEKGPAYTAKRNAMYRVNSTSLSAPLMAIGAGFHRKGDFYSAFVYISSKNKNVFTGLSRKLKAEFGEKWHTISSDAVGYLIENRGVQVLFARGNEGRDRVAVIGDAGAIPRKLNEYSVEEFVSDVRELEQAANTLLDVCLQKLEKTQKFIKPPEVTLYL
tara:strand:+ start:2282 stop:2860 length:579 start_codon:yes stop_codon:yes gene_type:complete